MPRRNIGRPRPRFLGATGRFSHAPVEVVFPVTFLLVGNNVSGLWHVPNTVALLSRVTAIQAGATGNDGSAKGGNGAGGRGGDYAQKVNMVVVPGSSILFHVGDHGLIGNPTTYSWFGGTSFIDAPLAAAQGALGNGSGHDSAGDTIVLGNAGAPAGGTGQGGSAGNFGVAGPWVSSIGQGAALGGICPIETVGNDYGGGGGGGRLGGFAGQVGGFGIIIIEL